MALVSIGERKPVVAASAYIDPDAVIIGDVEVGEGAGVWPGAVVRGDDASVTPQRGAMVLENCVIEAPEGKPVVIGQGAIVSHGAIIHGGEVGPRVLVGIGAIVLDGATVGEKAIIGAGAVVPPGSEVPPKVMVLGIPGKQVREVSEEELKVLFEEHRTLSRKLGIYRQIRGQGGRDGAGREGEGLVAGDVAT